MRAGMPSIRVPASSETISASVELWETGPCFLHDQEMGILVRGPTKNKIHPPVDLESLRSPANPASQNSAR